MGGPAPPATAGTMATVHYVTLERTGIRGALRKTERPRTVLLDPDMALTSNVRIVLRRDNLVEMAVATSPHDLLKVSEWKRPDVICVCLPLIVWGREPVTHTIMKLCRRNHTKLLVYWQNSAAPPADLKVLDLLDPDAVVGMDGSCAPLVRGIYDLTGVREASRPLHGTSAKR